MDLVANLAFTAVFLAIVFGYEAYREKKRAEIERLLIEQGKADAVVELRRVRHQAMADLIWNRRVNPWYPIAIGLAALGSAALLRAAGQYVATQGADVWFAVFGVFALGWGFASWLAKRRA